MDRITKTIDSYNKNCNSFNHKFSEYEPYQNRVQEFIELIGTNKKVLDLGCGPGNVSKQLMLYGKEFDIFGIDLSEEMVKLARLNVPVGEFICEDIRAVSFPEDSFDVILLSFCIVHLSDAETAGLIQKVAQYLRPQGKLLISFMEGKEDGFEKTSFSEDEIYFCYHTTDDIVTLLEENKLSIMKVTKQGYLEENGTSTTDVFIFAEKL